MKRSLAPVLWLCLPAVLVPSVMAADKEKAKAKQALQALNDYVGSYKGNGSPETPRPDPKDTWGERVNWSWRFKGDDCWLQMEVEKGKHLKRADLRYLPGKELYQLTTVAADGENQVYEGKLKDEILILDRIAPDSKETQRLKMNTAGDGTRFIYRLERKRPGRTIFAKEYKVECSKEGESLSGGGKKNECIVTGGIGTIAVSFKGMTYYVCCSGCRDAFQEDPEKYVREYNLRKKK
jgi:YHS domain